MSSGKVQGIRETIHLFSNILASCGVPKIPSESFRLAKFNKPEATKTFWSLLFNVIQVLNFLDGDGCGEISVELSFQSVISNVDLRLISFTVRNHFYRVGYSRLEFYADCEIGSRELLLALTWLIHKGELFSKLRAYQLRLACEVAIPLKPNRRVLVGEMYREAEETGNEIELTLQELKMCKDSEALQRSLQKLTWLKGKLQKCWKSMLNAHLAYQKMANSLHKCTVRTPQHTVSPHLAVHELFLLQFPERLSAYLKKLECHISILQNLVLWEYHQPLFWQWMESILDLCDKEKTEAAIEGESSTDNCSESEFLTTREGATCECGIPNFEVLTKDVRRLERDVAQLLDKNKPHIDRLNQVWEVKKRHIKSQHLDHEMDKLHKDFQHLSLSGGSDHRATIAIHAAVQVLGVIDTAVYLPKEITQAERVPKSMAASVVSQQQEVNASLLQASRSEVAQMHAAALHMEECVQSLRSEIGKQLKTILETLPPSIHKVDSCTSHHSLQ